MRSNSLALEPRSVRALDSIAEDEEQVILRVRNASFSWPCDGDPFACGSALKAIDLEVRRGSLTVVVGHVGSGKSSLLLALIGELNLDDGCVTWARGTAQRPIDQTLGYVAQRPWLMQVHFKPYYYSNSSINYTAHYEIEELNT